jgi:hypothetical protein
MPFRGSRLQSCSRLCCRLHLLRICRRESAAPQHFRPRAACAATALPESEARAAPISVASAFVAPPARSGGRSSTAATVCRLLPEFSARVILAIWSSFLVPAGRMKPRDAGIGTFPPRTSLRAHHKRAEHDRIPRWQRDFSRDFPQPRRRFLPRRHPPNRETSS